MKYMLLIYMHEQAMNQAEREQCYKDSTQLAHDLNAAGQYLEATPLQPVATAQCVRVRDGKPLVTDGPFAETREHLGGYFLINAKNLDDAINIASRIPGAKKGTVEIRPVMESWCTAGPNGEVEGLPTPDDVQPNYMFLVYPDREHWDRVGEAAKRKAMGEILKLIHDLKAKGQFRAVAPLEPTSTATCVRVREGKRLITDGPFAETREHLGGYYLIRAKDMQEALGIAARHAGASADGVEVRPVIEIQGLPQGS
jgi:hypothetical protein